MKYRDRIEMIIIHTESVKRNNRCKERTYVSIDTQNACYNTKSINHIKTKNKMIFMYILQYLAYLDICPRISPLGFGSV